jgi:hypothetical protein
LEGPAATILAGSVLRKLFISKILSGLLWLVLFCGTPLAQDNTWGKLPACQTGDLGNLRIEDAQVWQAGSLPHGSGQAEL